MSLKTRLILIIVGLVCFFILVGLIIWSSIMLSQVPEKYEKYDANYHKALTFGLINGLSDFIALVLIVNILIFSYSIKIFKLIKDWTNSKKHHKPISTHESHILDSEIPEKKNSNEVNQCQEKNTKN